MHDGEHHDSGSQVIEINGNQEGDDGQGPNHFLALTGTKKLTDKVEATIIVQYFHNRHGRQKKENDFRSPAHIRQENVTGDKIFDRNAVGWNLTEAIRMKEMRELVSVLASHEVHTITDIENPSHRSSKNRYGSTVHLGDILRRDEEISHQ